MSKLSDYFSDEELKCKGSGIVKLDPNFERELLIYRETVGLPMYVNSCCRSEKYNAEIGGAKTSYHMFEGVEDGRKGTLAIDIKIFNDAQRAVMQGVALNLGWSVGTYKNFIHIDRRVDIGKEQISFWGKY